MNAAATIEKAPFIDRDDVRRAMRRAGELKWGLLLSILFHVGVVAVGFMGLPYLKRDTIVIQDSIAVTLVSADSVSENPQAPPPAKTQKRPPQNTAPEPPRRIMPTVATDTPPSPLAPQRPETQIITPIDNPPLVAPPARKPVFEKPVPEEAPPEQQQENFQSLLRNLMPDEPQSQASETHDNPDEAQESSFLTNFQQSVTADEMGALRSQLSGCCSVQAGARFAEDLIVPLRIFVNRDRSVRNIEIMERGRYNSDTFYRAAADSAVRAIYRCNPLALPADKYDLWKTIVIRFDPSGML